MLIPILSVVVVVVIAQSVVRLTVQGRRKDPVAGSGSRWRVFNR